MQKTSVTLLLDRSGSMDWIKSDTIGGYNTFVRGLKEGDAADDTEFTFVQFDSQSIDKVHVSEAIKNIPDLTNATYQPRGSTPLIDAAYVTIKAVEKAVEGSDKKVVIAIQTDGQENASTQHTWDDLNQLIKEKTALGWQFNFLGTGIDAYDQGHKMGIATANIASSGKSSADINSSYRSMTMNTASYAAGQSVTTEFSEAQKFGMGDKYDPSSKKDQSKSFTLAGNVKITGATATPRKPIVDDLDLTK